MKKIVISLALLFIVCSVIAQSNSKVKAAVDTFNTGKLMDGISMMQKITDDEPTTDNWDMLVQMYQMRYKFSHKSVTDQAVIQVGIGLGLKPKDDDNPRICFRDFIGICRKAGLYSTSPTASRYLRTFFVDYEPDTAISKDAKNEFETAEDLYGKKDYKTAVTHYRRALQMEPNYYQANIYCGDSYWYQENMDSAIYFFNKGITMHPDLLEPRKYIVDALGYAKRNAEAEEQCIDAIDIYPDEGMYLKLADLAVRRNKKLDRHWIKRDCEVNKMGVEQTKADDKRWKLYQEAKNEIKNYCDSNGVIVKPNNLTKAKYLEVYSFEKMLDWKGKLPDELAFAKKMEDEGYLDCYVFISVFHYDMYGQYKSFAKDNKERIKKYIDTYLIQ